MEFENERATDYSVTNGFFLMVCVPFLFLLKNVLNDRICVMVRGRDFWLLSESFDSLKGKCL